MNISSWPVRAGSDTAARLRRDPRRSVYPIRLMLFALTALPMLALVALLVYDSYRQYLSAKSEAIRIASIIRAVSATQTAEFLGRARFILTTLAQHPDVQALDARHCDPALVALKQFHPAYANLLTLDKDGRLVCSAQKVAPGAARGPDRKFYFDEMIRTGAFTVGKPTRGFATGRLVSTLAYPIRDTTGAITGAVAIAVDLLQYKPLISSSELPPNTVIGIINKNGTIVARSENANQRVGKLSNTQSAQRMLKERSGVFTGYDYRGVRRLFAFAPIANSDWILFVALDRAAIFAPVVDLAKSRLALILLLTLAVSAILIRVIRHIAAPVLDISQTMQQVGAGATAARATVGGPMELRKIASQLNAMLDALAQADIKVRQSEERFRTAFQTSPNALAITTLRDGTYLEVNDGFTPMYGWQREELIGKSVHQMQIWRYPEDRQKMVQALQQDGTCIDLEAEFVRKDGAIRTGLVSAHLIALDGEQCVLSIIMDISARKASEAQIHDLSFSDPLTHLPNRRLLMDRLGQALISSIRSGRYGALVFVDLDDFKTINENFGLDHGDRMLEEVAGRLRRCVREGDTIARLGGDEFVLLLEDLSTQAQHGATRAERLSRTILAALAQPHQFDHTAHHCTASIGITLFGERQEDPVEPLKRAELAMYQAKAAGRNTLRFFDPQMQSAVHARAALESGLRAAIQNDHLDLHYQAQVTHQHRITGVEALVRWNDPRRGMISPSEFIPFAEQSGLILPLGQWVIETACAQIARWRALPEFAHLTVAVNVSARQFAQVDFVDQVLHALERSGASPQRLKLEMTESMLASNIEDVITKMNALKAIGVGFSLDDFGTGYSSLSYLKRLPLEQLKIDQGFVRDILVDPNDAAIAKMVIALASSMGLTVIAEGVETEAQRGMLEGLGCRNYQGYLFSRPVPVNEFEALMRDRASRASIKSPRSASGPICVSSDASAAGATAELDTAVAMGTI